MLGRNGNTAYVRYDSQGNIVPGGPIISASAPKGGNWKSVQSVINNSPSNSILKAFIRIDMFGRVVPSSLVLLQTAPPNINNTTWLQLAVTIADAIRESCCCKACIDAMILLEDEIALIQGEITILQDEFTAIYDNFMANEITFTCGDPTPIGDFVTFTKTDYGDEVDVIIPGVLEITRGDNQGIYNSAIEASYDYPSSPANTEWNSLYTDAVNYGWGDLSNIGDRTYDNWRESINGNPPNSVTNELELIMRETSTGRIWEIQFLQWTQGGMGGGFSYRRRELAPPVCGGITFGDGTTLYSVSDVYPPNDIYTIVGSGFIIDDVDTITLPENFENWLVRVYRNNVLLDGVDLGDPYFTQDVLNNTIELSQNTIEGEKFAIMAYKKV